MTNEFKENILDYITNNMNVTSKSTTQLLEKVEEIPRSDYSSFLPDHWSSLQMMGIIKSSTNENYVLYGGYVPQGLTADADSRGIIIILDYNLRPIKTIYQFITGTNLRPIQKMIQIEDGTFVAIDSTIFASSDDRSLIQSNTKRFIMLNNLSTSDSNGNYNAILRTSYNLPYSNFFCIDMIKNPNSSHYAMAGATYIPSGGGHNDGIRFIDLKINVGEPNEWNEKASGDNEYMIYGGFYGEFDNDDNISWQIVATRNATPVTLESWNGSNYSVVLAEDSSLKPFVDSLSMANQVKFVNKDEMYFVVNNQRWGSTIQARYVALYKYNFANSFLKNIYYKNIGNYDYNESREGIFLNSLNGELYINYNDNYNYTNKTANFNYQRLENDIWNPILVKQDKMYRMESTLNFTGNTYNLITNVEFSSIMNTYWWEFLKINEIYNSNNYNSSPYNDYNSTIPKYVNLYNTNGILFSRNLYNLTLNGSTTTATVQVPNTFLNGVSINQEKLISSTNSILVNETQSITKNIYETLYLNFIQTLSVKDEDTNNEYPIIASYINQNINTGTQQNCENTFIGKVNVNYSNNTITQNINWTYVTDHYETTFVIDATNEVPTIDFISNDETTIYLTKELDVSTGHYYTIKQKLRIE